MSTNAAEGTQTNGTGGSLEEQLDSERIANVNTLSLEIERAIEEARELQHFDYIVGRVTDYGVSDSDHAHFTLVHADNPIHCVIFSSRRAEIDASLTEGQQVAVGGDISYYPPENRCSIEVEEVVPVDGGDSSHPFERFRADRHVQIALASVLLLVVLLIGTLLLL